MKDGKSKWSERNVFRELFFSIILVVLLLVSIL